MEQSLGTFWEDDVMQNYKMRIIRENATAQITQNKRDRYDDALLATSTGQKTTWLKNITFKSNTRGGDVSIECNLHQKLQWKIEVNYLRTNSYFVTLQ